MFKPFEGTDSPGLTQSILFTGLVLTVILGFPVHPSLTAPASRPWAAAQLLSCSVWLEMLWPEVFKKGRMGSVLVSRAWTWQVTSFCPASNSSVGSPNSVHKWLKNWGGLEAVMSRAYTLPLCAWREGSLEESRSRRWRDDPEARHPGSPAHPSSGGGARQVCLVTQPWASLPSG